MLLFGLEQENSRSEKMCKARSAKGLVSLGATLIAVTLPVSPLMAEVASGLNGISGGDTAGISGGDVTGISGGDGQGISGGDGLGISGGDGLGISGGDGLGISGGDGLGISGGDGLGISGGDGLGISGGDGLGISGGDILGISGGDGLGISGGDVVGISGGDVLGISGGDVTVLSGPVDSIDRINGVFESMGQIVMASQGMLADMRVGDYVSVNGSVVAPGWLYADGLSVAGTRYVPGSTEVFVSGMLSSVDLRNGTAQMGELTIDYTSSLGNAVAPAGAMWSFRGTRPASDGPMISNRSRAR